MTATRRRCRLNNSSKAGSSPWRDWSTRSLVRVRFTGDNDDSSVAITEFAISFPEDHSYFGPSAQGPVGYDRVKIDWIRQAQRVSNRVSDTLSRRSSVRALCCWQVRQSSLCTSRSVSESDQVRRVLHLPRWSCP